MWRSSILRVVVYAGLIVFPGTLVYASGDAANNPVIQWNKTLLIIVRTKGAQPATIHSTRSFAILHTAIYDAVNSIDGGHAPYRIHIEGVSPHASQDAAADQAAHDVLVGLYPSFQSTLLDTQLEQALAAIPDGSDKVAGVDVGRAVAAAALALRADDGSAATPPLFEYTNPPVAGQYQVMPPNLLPQPQFTHWSAVRTWVLNRANQFRPGPPPALTSQQYMDVFNKVKSVGVMGSTTVMADQALTGTFWNGSIQNYWNEITQSAALAKNLNTAQTARLFALVDLSLADVVIAFYDAKYTYNFWRPVTAIRADGLTADQVWLPEVKNTANDPSYPGAHASVSEAAAFVLKSFFKTNQFPLQVTSEIMPGVTRPFDSFGAAEKEASLSRIFAGVHFGSDEDAGEVLGRSVADFVTDHALQPVFDDEDDRDDQ